MKIRLCSTLLLVQVRFSVDEGLFCDVLRLCVDGMYQVIEIKDQVFELEQKDGSYTHKVKATIEELIK